MSGTYLRPTSAFISDTWQGHKNRTPPSSEPGTDYACATGTPLVAPAAGYISDAKSSNGAATGRYLTLSLDDGRTVRWLHLTRYVVGRGERFTRGQVLAYSGASANGSDWGVGAHVHVTLWPGSIWAAPTIDFELFVGEPVPAPPPIEEEDEMSKTAAVYYTRGSDNQRVNLVFNPGSGWWMEYLQSSVFNTNNGIAETLDTGTFASVTEAWATSAKNALEKVQREDVPVIPPWPSSSSDPDTTSLLTGPAWLIGAILGLIGLVEVVRLVLDFVIVN